MKLVFRAGLGLSVNVFCICAALPALAQQATAAAQTLFEDGRAEMDAHNYESACKKLRQSDKLDPAPGTELNLAECESRLGRLATAWELFRAVEQQLSRTDPRYPIAKARREELAPQLPKLLLVLAPGAPESTIVRDGDVTLGSAAFGISLPLDPGRHTLAVSAPGRSERRFEVVLTAGHETTLSIEPGVPLAAPAPPTLQAPPIPPRASSSTEKPSKAPAYVFGSIGLVGLAVGGVAGGLTLQAKSTNADGCDAVAERCTPDAKEAAHSGRTYGTITTVGLATAVVGLGLGTYFLVRAGKNGQRAAISAQAAPGTAGVAFAQIW